VTVVRRLVEAIQHEDIDAFAALYAHDAVLHEPLYPEPVSGRDAIAEGEAGLFRAFSDVSIEVKNELIGESFAVAEVVLNATNDGPLGIGDGEIPPTGRRVSIPMVWVLELSDDGAIREERDYFDPGSIMQQLGLAEDV